LAITPLISIEEIDRKYVLLENVLEAVRFTGNNDI
jgi:hypothetical protein